MSQPKLQVPDNALHGVITVGNFDGVHRGHQQMLKALCEIARVHSAPAVVVTFDPHPLSLLRPDAPLPRLTSIARRTQLLRDSGADEVVVLPVTHDLLQMTADDFFTEILVGQLAAKGIVEGPNFHFGRDRNGDVRHLARLCRNTGIAFQVIRPVEDDGRLISSSRIRKRLGEGRVLDAVAMTGHPHRISGEVARGARRGRQLGFPTANLEDIAMMLPTNGVYAGMTTVDGETYVVAVSIGPNPTFDDNRLKVECYLDGFTGDLYGQRLDVDLLSEVRPLCSFDSVEALKTQIQTDVAECQARVARLTQPIYKICRADEWEVSVTVGEYAGSEVDVQDGYIHFSTPTQVKETAAKYFADQSDLILVSVDPLLLGATLKWEASRGGDLFPHLYDRLAVDAATDVVPLPWREGMHQFPDF